MKTASFSSGPWSGAHMTGRPGFKRQRGISLFVIMVIVLLSMLLALWASRTSWFGELVVGNDADYQRALEAAQAMLQDAELDIRRSKADGSECENLTGTGDLCRADSAVLKFPAEEKNVGRLLDALAAQPTGCQHGLCRKRTGAQDFWENTTTLNAMRAAGVGARYGQYTGAAVGAAGDLGSNSILKDRLAAASGAWYWIEVLPYTTSAGTSGLITGGSQSVVALHMIPSVAYRVTALASGRKPNSQVVLQQTYVRQKLKD